MEETYSNSNDEEQIEHFNKRLEELEENIESLEADLQLKNQVIVQMDQGVALFERQAIDEASLR